MSLRQDEDGKVRDVALRLWLVETHDEWGHAYWEPVEDSLRRWASVFGPDASPHGGDCTNQCYTCMTCIREEWMDKARARIARDAGPACVLEDDE